MRSCFRRRCAREPTHSIQFIDVGGVSDVWACQRHARAARAATDFVGAEPVYQAMDRLRLAGPFGWLLRPFAQQRPRLLREQEAVLAAGRGYLLPLLSTQAYGEGIALATSENRIVVVEYGQIIFEADWNDVESHDTGEMELPFYDQRKYAIQLHTGHRTGRYILAIRPQDESDWLDLLSEHSNAGHGQKCLYQRLVIPEPGPAWRYARQSSGLASEHLTYMPS